MDCFIRKSEEKCGCIPWNYPHLNEHSILCDGKATICFETSMENGFSQDECGCLDNCESVEYIVSAISRHPINVAKECYRKNPEEFTTEFNLNYGDGLKVDRKKTYDLMRDYDISVLLGEKLR